MDEVEKTEAMISMGEILARTRQPGHSRCPQGRLPVPRDPIPEDVLRSVPERPFELDKEEFLHSLRTARRGAERGPSGMRTKHLGPLLDNEGDSNKFFEVAQ